MVQCQLGQFGHAAGDGLQRCLGFAVQPHQPLQHQLAQDAQCRTQVIALTYQLLQRLFHGLVQWGARQQQWQLIGVAPVQPLEKAGMAGNNRGRNGASMGGVRMDGLHGLCGSAVPQVNRHWRH